MYIMNKIILGISGSLRKESVTLKLMKAFSALAPQNIEFRVADLSKLPIYNQDLELPEPDFLIEFKEQIKSADGVIFLTPEYNRSIPPVLKNALDWASRPQARVGRGTWGGKPAGVVGVTPYTLGAFGAVHHLRQVLSFLNMPTMQQPEFYLSHAEEKFDENGKLTDEVTIKFINNFWTEFDIFSERFKGPSNIEN